MSLSYTDRCILIRRVNGRVFEHLRQGSPLEKLVARGLLKEISGADPEDPNLRRRFWPTKEGFEALRPFRDEIQAPSQAILSIVHTGTEERPLVRIALGCGHTVTLPASKKPVRRFKSCAECRAQWFGDPPAGTSPEPEKFVVKDDLAEHVAAEADRSSVRDQIGRVLDQSDGEASAVLFHSLLVVARFARNDGCTQEDFTQMALQAFSQAKEP